MKIKNKIFGLTAISAVLVSAIFGSSMALAKSRDCDRCHKNDCNKNHCEERCTIKNPCSVDDDDFWRSRAFSTEFRQIAENGDYNAWRDTMWRYGFLSSFGSVNEGNFPRFVQAMRLMDCGDTAKARAIVRDLIRTGRAYNRGFQDGFNVGFVTGYNVGYHDGVEDTICAAGAGMCVDGYGIRY